MKLVLEEAEHAALRVELAEWDGFVSSALLAVEAVRACARYSAGCAADARSWLEGIALLPLGDAVLEEASAMAPAGLRSLDALHLATALSLGDDLGAFVTHDHRLATAASERGLPVVQPA